MPNSNFWTYPFGLKKPATPNFWSGNAPATQTNSPSLSAPKYPFSITGRQSQPFGMMAPITPLQNKSFMPLDQPIRAPWYQFKPTPVKNNTTPNTTKIKAPTQIPPIDLSKYDPNDPRRWSDPRIADFTAFLNRNYPGAKLTPALEAHFRGGDNLPTLTPEEQTYLNGYDDFIRNMKYA